MAAIRRSGFCVAPVESSVFVQSAEIHRKNYVIGLKNVLRMLKCKCTEKVVFFYCIETDFQTKEST